MRGDACRPPERKRTLLNDAREHVPDERRATLADAFTAARAGHLAVGCGSVANVREIVARAKN